MTGKIPAGNRRKHTISEFMKLVKTYITRFYLADIVNDSTVLWNVCISGAHTVINFIDTVIRWISPTIQLNRTTHEGNGQPRKMQWKTRDITIGRPLLIYTGHSR